MLITDDPNGEYRLRSINFGVEKLLSKCKIWLSVLALSKDTALPKLGLTDLIQMWSFGLEHEIRMYHLLFQFILPSSIKHPHLTVDSEMHLADALLIWLDAGRRMSDFSESSSSQDNTINLMEQLTFRRSVTYAEITFSETFRTKLVYTFFALWNSGPRFKKQMILSLRLLSKCKSWLSVLASSNDTALPKLELSDLIQIWSFGLEHG
ncbi:hypothetical protein ARALYDRAFT_902942 [Arabidopsis lyrata subsp. lyrata]|uniref:BACK domain-containing protein n=1 Tax=Arabidopsis lyrata subsp. lyrata TaxID=81972 RepID=D7LKE6_ARALL|nr:hypothetical protein ARALYDRAFT_902942 [Arabidopsis lyrata subsp. lyrata]